MRIKIISDVTSNAALSALPEPDEVRAMTRIMAR